MAEKQLQPLEVAFVYPPYPPRPLIDQSYYFFIDIALLYGGIVAGVATLKKQRWAWFLTLALFVSVFAVHFAASLAFGPDSAGTGFVGAYDSSTGRFASLVISVIGVYLLSRKDVRSYFRTPIVAQ